MLEWLLYDYRFWCIFLFVAFLILAYNFLIIYNCLTSSVTGKQKYVLLVNCDDELSYKAALLLSLSKVKILAGSESKERVTELNNDRKFNGTAVYLDVTNKESIEALCGFVYNTVQDIGTEAVL